ncbi:MAG: adenylate/guanylate cyclase domain-containing protein, partial [Stellaceae bacterium]
MQRRLTSILAADVVGFSRLAAVDEEGTVSRLRALRHELIDPVIAANYGRTFKTTGDGRLAEFPSVVDAVRAALDVQRGMVRRNENVAAEKRIEFRVGIHLGDVIVEQDGDLMGDGVNVAARLEGIAEPGGICLSSAAYEQVRDKLDAVFADLGETELKNIARPVRVYAISPQNYSTTPRDARLVTEVASSEGKKAPHITALPDKPSIAVLPFQNMSGDAEQEYFADGMVEDIITGLARINWLFVVARNSSFAYKGKSPDIRQVGRELGVRYVLEGSVRKGGNRVRITGQLIEVETGTHVWADRYDRPLDDVFAVQDE